MHGRVELTGEKTTAPLMMAAKVGVESYSGMHLCTV